MTTTDSDPYPGAAASPADIFMLAREYRSAADALMAQGRAGEPISRAPARLCAIHAIELYLNAFLLSGGIAPERVRGHFHDLAERAELALGIGLVLRKMTHAHLKKMTEGREYLISRYGPEKCSALSECNRLMATLNEVAKKVEPRVSRSERWVKTA